MTLSTEPFPPSWLAELLIMALANERLAIQHCQPVYEATPSLASAASSAIASATSAALAALATRKPTNLADYPSCAVCSLPSITMVAWSHTRQQTCIPPGLAANASGCLSLSNPECVCRCPTVIDIIAPCEQSLCSTEDVNRESNPSTT